MRKKVDMFTLTTFIQRFIWSPSQWIQTRERKESYLSWKRSTTIFVGKCDYLYRIFIDVRKELLELMSLAWLQNTNSACKSQLYFYILIMNSTKVKFKKLLTIASKICKIMHRNYKTFLREIKEELKKCRNKTLCMC